MCALTLMVYMNFLERWDQTLCSELLRTENLRFLYVFCLKDTYRPDLPSKNVSFCRTVYKREDCRGSHLKTGQCGGQHEWKA